MSSSWDLALQGPSGEPVSFERVLLSHGLASLVPNQIDEDSYVLRTTLRMPRSKPRSVEVSRAASGAARVTVRGRPPGERTIQDVEAAIRWMLRLDEDLGPFYDVARADPELRWAASGAGRWMRSQTVFEDLIKTICTTNCTWAGTVRMVEGLVSHLGEPAAGAPHGGPLGRAFPTPAAMAEAEPAFYKEEVRAGYRGPYLRSLAEMVASGELDVESWAILPPDGLDDAELENELLGLPGVGPYAAAHMLMLLGRYSRLILDSWTRPKYARLKGRKASDATIVKRFSRYGPYAGLAFWLFLTKDWIEP